MIFLQRLDSTANKIREHMELNISVKRRTKVLIYEKNTMKCPFYT